MDKCSKSPRRTAGLAMRLRPLLFVLLGLAACYPVTLRTLENRSMRGGVISFQTYQEEEARQKMTDYCDGGFTVTKADAIGETMVEGFECAWGPARIVFDDFVGGIRQGMIRYERGDPSVTSVLRAHCDGGVTEIESRGLPLQTVGTAFLCGDSPREREVALRLRSDSEATVQRQVEQGSLPFGVIDFPERGLLEVGTSHRVAGKYWEFVVAYTNTTGAALGRVEVECVTLLGRRVLNANSRAEFDGVAAGEQVIFKVPVEDVSQPADSGSCRITKATR